MTACLFTGYFKKRIQLKRPISVSNKKKGKKRMSQIWWQRGGLFKTAIIKHWLARLLFTGDIRWKGGEQYIFLFCIFKCLRGASVQTLIKLPEAALDRSSRTSSQHRYSFFVNLRKKVVSHETHRDTLWMITPNWSVTALYACFHLASRVVIKICWYSIFWVLCDKNIQFF